MACAQMTRNKAAGFILLLGLLALSTLIQPAAGAIECEELPVKDCAFAVSASGARCVLEKEVLNNGAAPEYKCQTSIIMAERPREWIETEDCINMCGLQRLSVGLSTDALLERDFTRKLCFSECRGRCPNIDDLYTKLAAEEGIYLPSLCNSLKPRGARKLVSAAARSRVVQKQQPQQQQQQQLQEEKQASSMEKPGVLQPELIVTWAPATTPTPTTAGTWPPTASAPSPEKTYPSSEPPSNDDDGAEAPDYEYTDELPPAPSHEEEPPSPAPRAALPPLFNSEQPSPAPFFAATPNPYF